MGILRAKIDVSEGTDPGQAKLLVWVEDTYEPPTFTRCRELEASNSFDVKLNAEGLIKYGDYAGQLNSMLASIWEELRGETSSGGVCEDIGGVFGLSGGTSRVGTPETVKASGSFGFSTCFEPYDCFADPNGELYSFFKCHVEATFEGYDLRSVVAALNPDGPPAVSSPFPRVYYDNLKAGVAAHPNGIAVRAGIYYELATASGRVVLNIAEYPSVGSGIASIWCYNPSNTGFVNANYNVWLVGNVLHGTMRAPISNYMPSTIEVPWVVSIISDEIDTSLHTTGGNYPYTYTIVGGPTFGVFDTSGTGIITAGPRILTMRDPGTPRPGCPIEWEYRNRTSVGCQTEWQLHVTRDHKDSPTKKAPCRVYTEAI